MARGDRLLAGGGDRAMAARQLRDQAARASIIVRDGAAGCLLAARADLAALLSRPSKRRRLQPRPLPLPRRFLRPRLTAGMAATAVARIPAPEVDAVDTTGAGDTHAGVFLAALAAGLNPGRAALRANVAAAS